MGNSMIKGINIPTHDFEFKVPLPSSLLLPLVVEVPFGAVAVGCFAAGILLGRLLTRPPAAGNTESEEDLRASNVRVDETAEVGRELRINLPTAVGVAAFFLVSVYEAAAAGAYHGAARADGGDDRGGEAAANPDA